MFAALWHRAIICSNYQHGVLVACDTRDHVVDEFLVAGHVYKPNVAVVYIREAEVNRQSAFLFFG